MKSGFIISIILPAILAGNGHAAVLIDPVSWTNGLGTPTNSGASSTGIVWGNNAANNVDNAAIHATIDGDDATAGNQVVSLALGDILTFSGSMNLQTGITDTAGTVQIRFGLYNTGGSGTVSNWLGYMAGNSSSSGTGAIYERANPNTGAYYSGTGASIITTAPSTNGGVVLASRNLTAGLYDFSLSLERTASGMVISSSMVRQSDSVNFAAVTGFLDTTPQTFTFDRIGFLAGGGLDADQVTLSAISLTVVPEPSSAMLGLLGMTALLRRRR